MRSKIVKYSLSVAVALTLIGCHSPEEPHYTTKDSVGITSLSARFVEGPYSSDPNAVFTALVTSPDQGEIVISIPWFYPETSDNPITDITKMRVQAATEAGTVITPALGVMDLTQSHQVEVQLPNGGRTTYTIRGSIDKLSGKQIEDLKVTDCYGENYSAIIDNEAMKVMIGSTNERLEGCTLTARLSPHATITSPDPATPTDLEPGDVITVTAHDGSTADFTVLIETPEKVDYGIRPASDKKMFIKYFLQDYNITIPAGAILRQAICEDQLLVSAGTKIHQFDRYTGEYKGATDAPNGLNITSLVNDSAGNLLLAGNAAFGSDFTIYRMRSLEESPELLLNYPYPTDIYSSGMGNLRVVGNIDDKAVISAIVDVSQYYVAWQIEGGVVGEATYGPITPFSTIWNPQAATVCPASDDLNDGLFAMGYAGVYDLFHLDMATGAWSVAVNTAEFINSNNNPNCLSLTEFNKARYLAFTVGTHFTWSFVNVYMYDASNPMTMNTAQCFHMSDEEILGPFIGTIGATSDILLFPSKDGFKLSLYFVDGNYDVMGSYEFDCVKK